MSTEVLNVGECLTAELPEYWDINCIITQGNGGFLGYTWADFTTSQQDIDADSGLEILFNSSPAAGAGVYYNNYITQTMDYKRFISGTTLKGYDQINNLRYKLGGMLRYSPGSGRNVGRIQVCNLTDGVVEWEVIAVSGNSNTWYWFEGSSGVIPLDISKQYTIRLQAHDAWLQLQYIGVSWEYIILELEPMAIIMPHAL